MKRFSFVLLAGIAAVLVAGCTTPTYYPQSYGYNGYYANGYNGNYSQNPNGYNNGYYGNAYWNNPYASLEQVPSGHVCTYSCTHFFQGGSWFTCRHGYGCRHELRNGVWVPVP